MNWLLEGGLLVDPAGGRVEAGTLAVAAGRIAPAGAEGLRVDVSGCLVLPGNVCAHHHLYSALARGMPGPAEPPRSFPEILERIWWRLDRALDPESIRLSALLGAVEAAKAGTTSLIDHHASPEAIDGSLDLVADAVAEAGVRGVVCYEVTDRHGADRGRQGIAENVRFLRENRRDLVRGMMGAHASFTLGPRTLERLVEEARTRRVPIHIHLAEDQCDEQDALERYGLRTAHRLARAGALGEGDLVAHGVHLDEEEQRLVREIGAWLIHNPRSNMNNGVGYAPVLRMGSRVALGTDGIDGDMFSETRACYLKAREASREVGPGFAVERLTAGAVLAGALFGEPLLGTLRPGAPADLVVLDYRPPTPMAAANVAGHFVFAFGAAGVRDVMVAGRWVVRDRRHQLVDEAALAARCREAAPRLWRRMEAF
ncbi:MAG: amidohydrolase family protein [Armatimonadota bacterium]|nr:amidohydrolase family protein [Armatimonadota bacterium]MDR7452841.1 amidohydrolase family protein [Armatimonadota bacterium]MDR7468405.1 amidohydrolase family protein [Armatimonadota bacterium]MDR7494978.1 amidohydrolase family protein [Armatimonadota bacterium]MDR7505858.1 amidohydrolase family protein [Armatimonadota bacterium]